MSREDARASRAWISDSGDPVDVISGGGRVGLRRRFQVASNDIQPPLCLSPPRNPPARPGPKSIHRHGRTRQDTLCGRAQRVRRTVPGGLGRCVCTPRVTWRRRRPHASPGVAPRPEVCRPAAALRRALKLSLSLYIKQRNTVTGPGPTREPLSGSESLREPEPERERERERFIRKQCP